MTTQTARLNEAHWNDIMALIERGKSDIAEYLPYAEKDGYTPDEVKNLERLLNGEASSLLSKQLAGVGVVSSEALSVRTYTAFCHELNGTGTTWIGTLEVPIQDYREDEQQEAAYQARCACARDWGRYIDSKSEPPREDICEIVCMGLVEGDVTIAMWDGAHLD
ncbi:MULTISPECIES: hypothetical protein [Halomonadaceae]|uniref:hypothetical protein n=1 Tax=Halomonadaceae TaxID=28256 RepID=UPI00022D3553|nr:hypothetical protein [Halomonas sp. HAL1]EHA16164.1 hypothetical protein HAL1_07340 [Halomonas sp. HAL1]WKV95105.1 hypothetical protein Q3Y66_20650 [Halomonas sp. HAL1]